MAFRRELELLLLPQMDNECQDFCLLRNSQPVLGSDG